MDQAAGSANSSRQLSPPVIVTSDLLEKLIGHQAHNGKEGKSKERKKEGWEKVSPSIGAAEGAALDQDGRDMFGESEK